MKKNFLLLFLMALLPLAGWAQTAEFGDMALGKYTYGDADFPAPYVKDSKGQTLTEGTEYTVEGGAFEDEACTKGIATDAQKAKMKADGTTKYYRKVVGKTGTAFAGQSKVAWFKVDKAKITLTYEANALDRTYGEDPKALDASKFSTPTLKFSQVWADIRKGSAPTGYSTADNNAGANKKVTFVGGWTADNYEIEYDVKLTIATKALVSAGSLITGVEITSYQGDVVYSSNQVTGAYTIKFGDYTLINNTDYTVAKVGPNVGSYGPTITFKNNYSGTYTIPDAKKFKITKAPITVSLKEDIKVTYDNSDKSTQTISSTNVDYAGFVGSDIAADKKATIISSFTAPTTAKVATDAVEAGDYTLVIQNGSAGETNYEFKTFLPGKLIIEPIKLSIKAAGTPKKNLGDADPEFTLATPTGLITGDKVTGVTFTRAGGEEVGSYDITPNTSAAKVMRGTDPEVDVTKNYDFVIADPKTQLIIGKGAIVVTIKNKEKFYGQADPEFEYVVTGLQDGDELAAFTIVREKAGKADGEKVGNYALTATVANPKPEKYTSLTVTPGILEIKKAQLTFTMPAQTVALNAPATALKKDDIKVDGINNSDDDKTLYDLSFKDAIDLTGNITIADGYKATLTDEAKKSYEIITNAKTNPVTVANTISGKLIVGTGSTSDINFTSTDAAAEIIADRYGETQAVTINFAPRNGRDYGDDAANINWKATKWTTMVLPFDISVADLSQYLGYAIVNVIDPTRTKVDGTGSEFYGKLTMTGGNGGDGVLKANKPFLVKIASDINPTKAYSFGSRLIVKADDTSVDAGGNCTFVGTYTKKTVKKDDEAAIWFMNGDEDGWQYIGATSSATWTIVPFEAYIDMSKVPAASRNITFYAEEIDGTVTAIKGISVDENGSVKLSQEGWYTLTGVKLQGAPIQKGIYIYNGKKYVVK